MLAGLAFRSHTQPNVWNVSRTQNPGFQARQLHLSRKTLCSTTIRTCLLSQSAEIPPTQEDHKRSHPLVKMCGITSARDAALAAEAGASLIGMILWPHSKRSVSFSVAKEISKVAREYGAEPVGVFVDDDASTILRVSDASDIELVQLHGDCSRAAFPVLLQERRIVYVLHVNEDGFLLNQISEKECPLVDWILVDSAKGGSKLDGYDPPIGPWRYASCDASNIGSQSIHGKLDGYDPPIGPWRYASCDASNIGSQSIHGGKGFDWARFKLPPIGSKHGWLLAGGINPENVLEALDTLRPNGVDVSSGICSSDGIQKDQSKILTFMSAVNMVNY